MSDLLWRPRTDGSRGPKPALTLDGIADAAITVADAEGLAAVSMQRVAADLGFTKMALYRYLPGKAELVALMVERALGGPPDLTGQAWRTRYSRRTCATPGAWKPSCCRALSGPTRQAGWRQPPHFLPIPA
jgi:AcrR family transcriptional regulator